MPDSIYNEVVSFIDCYVVDKSGKLPNSRLNANWFLSRNKYHIYNEILKNTSALFDNETLNAERIYCYKLKLENKPKCLHCESTTTFFTYKKGYHLYCSESCRKSSKLIVEKRKNTNILRYGVDNPTKNINIANKVRESHLNKTNQQKSNSNTKRQNTTMLKYGVDNISKMGNVDGIKKIKIKQSLTTLQNRTDIEALFDQNDFNIPFKDRKYKCTKCGNVFKYSGSGHSNDYRLRCYVCYPLFQSKDEADLLMFLKSIYTGEIITNTRNIINGELDFLIPSSKIAIEYNGIFWHSENNGYRNISYDYHLKKTNECMQKDITLFHIFQNEWLDHTKKEIWKSILKSKLNLNITIYARKCIIKELTFKECEVFLENNHLQGKDRSSIRYGLFHNNILVAVLSLSKARFNKKYQWEITRYCNILHHNVVGGFSKLLAHFRKNHSGSIITYADKRYSSGNLYRKFGFRELKDSKPNYWYFKERTITILSRLQFQKHKLADKLPNFNESKTEWENMKEHGYNRIWDCGNKVFCLE